MGNILDQIPLASNRTYKVQPGDSLESISAKFVRSDRWPELVAVNQMHKGLVAGPPDTDHMVFDSIHVGEHLLVPASWMPNTGTVGDPLIINQLSPTLDPTTAFISAVVSAWPGIQATAQQVLPGFTVPAPYNETDIANVLAGWIPFLIRSGVPVAQPASWNQDHVRLLAQLVINAATLLNTAQIPSETFIRNIPWLRMPWTEFPWQATVVPGATNLTAGIWQMLGSVIPTVQNSPAQYGLPGKMVVKSTPATLNYAKIDFGATPWTQVPWGQMPWGTLDPTVLADTELQTCLKDADANTRLQEMAKYKDCFIGANADVLKKYLCKKNGAYEDVTKCGGATPTPPPEQTTCPTGTTPVQTQAGQGCIPTIPGLPTGVNIGSINWNCTPYPDCINQQVAAMWPAAVPTPCPTEKTGGTWPSCLPALISQYGGTLPPAVIPLPTTEEKKDNTGLYVALGLGGAVLLGGILFAATRTPAPKPAVEDEVSENPTRRKASRGKRSK